MRPKHRECLGRLACVLTLTAVSACAAIGGGSPVPKVNAEFHTYRPTTAISGSLYIYLRNETAQAVALESVRLDGKDLEALKTEEIVAWYRLWPRTLAPGKLGELLIRFQSLPAAWATELFLDEHAQVEAALDITLEGGISVRQPVKLSAAPEPVQINFVAFGPELRRLYVYVQNNEVMPGGRQATYHLSHVGVDGADVTARSRFGQPVLSDTVVPVEVTLPEPLARGEPAVVTIGTEEGVRAGLTVRAIPSEFPVQVVLFPQLRADGVQDVYNHGFDCVGLCGGGDERLPEAKKLGMYAFHYGGGQNHEKAFRTYWDPAFAEFKAYWLDEIDRYPVGRCEELLVNAERRSREKGRFFPFHTLNIMAAQAPHGVNWFELADGITHEYGLDGIGPHKEFAAYKALAKREYRQARRPFLPYLRNAEIGFEIDREKQALIGLPANRPYPLMPDEERFLTYGCLMFGAKGMLHWGYGHMYYKRAPNWFSDKHHALRLSMGGLPGDQAYGCTIPREVVGDLRAVWDEIGRINVELRTLGDLIAISDVSNLARVTEAVPSEGPGHWDKRPAEVASLVCGADTIVLLVLNMNLKTGWWARRQREHRIESYPPVDVTVQLRIPPWLKPQDCFSVNFQRIAPVRAVPVQDGLEFRFPRLAVSEAVVLTADRALRGRMAGTLGLAQQRLRAVQTHRAEPLPLCLGEGK
ncbi:MAG: hypothetical protein JXR37_05790 [Kiritimatiellae bacterium]|nr:hypothetical protein [Kiritimatiellia bacterium]